MMRYQSSPPDKQEPFLPESESCKRTSFKNMLLLNSDWATSENTIGNLPADKFRTSRGAQWGQESLAEGYGVCAGDSASFVVSFLNLHVPVVIDM